VAIGEDQFHYSFHYSWQLIGIGEDHFHYSPLVLEVVLPSLFVQIGQVCCLGFLVDLVGNHCLNRQMVSRPYWPPLLAIGEDQFQLLVA
jgi:hypothetical protein